MLVLGFSNSLSDTAIQQQNAAVEDLWFKRKLWLILGAVSATAVMGVVASFYVRDKRRKTKNLIKEAAKSSTVITPLTI